VRIVLSGRQAGFNQAPRRPDMLEELSCRVLQRDAARNEHDARASIDVRPAFELHRRMKHVMHAVNGDRCALADQIEDT